MHTPTKTKQTEWVVVGVPFANRLTLLEKSACEKASCTNLYRLRNHNSASPTKKNDVSTTSTSSRNDQIDVSLAFVTIPALQEPLGFEAREFIRRHFLGVTVEFNAVFGNFCGHVEKKETGESLAISLLRHGLATMKPDTRRMDKTWYDAAEKEEEFAKKKHAGVHALVVEMRPTDAVRCTMPAPTEKEEMRIFGNHLRHNTFRVSLERFVSPVAFEGHIVPSLQELRFKLCGVSWFGNDEGLYAAGRRCAQALVLHRTVSLAVEAFDENTGTIYCTFAGSEHGHTYVNILLGAGVTILDHRTIGYCKNAADMYLAASVAQSNKRGCWEAPEEDLARSRPFSGKVVSVPSHNQLVVEMESCRDDNDGSGADDGSTTKSDEPILANVTIAFVECESSSKGMVVRCEEGIGMIFTESSRLARLRDHLRDNCMGKQVRVVPISVRPRDETQAKQKKGNEEWTLTGRVFVNHETTDEKEKRSEEGEEEEEEQPNSNWRDAAIDLVGQGAEISPITSKLSFATPPGDDLVEEYIANSSIRKPLTPIDGAEGHDVVQTIKLFSTDIVLSNGSEENDDESDDNDEPPVASSSKEKKIAEGGKAFPKKSGSAPASGKKGVPDDAGVSTEDAHLQKLKRSIVETLNTKLAVNEKVRCVIEEYNPPYTFGAKIEGTDLIVPVVLAGVKHSSPFDATDALHKEVMEFVHQFTWCQQLELTVFNRRRIDEIDDGEVVSREVLVGVLKNPSTNEDLTTEVLLRGLGVASGLFCDMPVAATEYLLVQQAKSQQEGVGIWSPEGHKHMLLLKEQRAQNTKMDVPPIRNRALLVKPEGAVQPEPATTSKQDRRQRRARSRNATTANLLRKFKFRELGPDAQDQAIHLHETIEKHIHVFHNNKIHCATEFASKWAKKSDMVVVMMVDENGEWYRGEVIGVRDVPPVPVKGKKPQNGSAEAPPEDATLFEPSVTLKLLDVGDVVSVPIKRIRLMGEAKAVLSLAAISPMVQEGSIAFLSLAPHGKISKPAARFWTERFLTVVNSPALRIVHEYDCNGEKFFSVYRPTAVPGDDGCLDIHETLTAEVLEAVPPQDIAITSICAEFPLLVKKLHRLFEVPRARDGRHTLQLMEAEEHERTVALQQQQLPLQERRASMDQEHDELATVTQDDVVRNNVVEDSTAPAAAAPSATASSLLNDPFLGGDSLLPEMSNLGVVAHEEAVPMVGEEVEKEQKPSGDERPQKSTRSETRRKTKDKKKQPIAAVPEADADDGRVTPKPVAQVFIEDDEVDEDKVVYREQQEGANDKKKKIDSRFAEHSPDEKTKTGTSEAEQHEEPIKEKKSRRRGKKMSEEPPMTQEGGGGDEVKKPGVSQAVTASLSLPEQKTPVVPVEKGTSASSERRKRERKPKKEKAPINEKTEPKEPSAQEKKKVDTGTSETATAPPPPQKVEHQPEKTVDKRRKKKVTSSCDGQPPETLTTVAKNEVREEKKVKGRERKRRSSKTGQQTEEVEVPTAKNDAETNAEANKEEKTPKKNERRTTRSPAPKAKSTVVAADVPKPPAQGDDAVKVKEPRRRSQKKTDSSPPVVEEEEGKKVAKKNKGNSTKKPTEEPKEKETSKPAATPADQQAGATPAEKRASKRRGKKDGASTKGDDSSAKMA